MPSRLARVTSSWRPSTRFHKQSSGLTAAKRGPSGAQREGGGHGAGRQVNTTRSIRGHARQCAQRAQLAAVPSDGQRLSGGTGGGEGCGRRAWKAGCRPCTSLQGSPQLAAPLPDCTVQPQAEPPCLLAAHRHTQTQPKETAAAAAAGLTQHGRLPLKAHAQAVLANGDVAGAALGAGRHGHRQHHLFQALGPGVGGQVSAVAGVGACRAVGVSVRHAAWHRHTERFASVSGSGWVARLGALPALDPAGKVGEVTGQLQSVAATACTMGSGVGRSRRAAAAPAAPAGPLHFRLPPMCSHAQPPPLTNVRGPCRLLPCLLFLRRCRRCLPLLRRRLTGSGTCRCPLLLLFLLLRWGRLLRNVWRHMRRSCAWRCCRLSARHVARRKAVERACSAGLRKEGALLCHKLEGGSKEGLRVGSHLTVHLQTKGGRVGARGEAARGASRATGRKVVAAQPAGGGTHAVPRMLRAPTPSSASTLAFSR